MIIEKLRVKNYKSLEDVEVPLRPLTVFVGPNNSGKSNILDCLEFVRDMGIMGPQAAGTRGGFEFVVWGGDLKRAIEIQFSGKIEDGKGRTQYFTYEIGIAGIMGSPANYLLANEKFALHRDGVEWKLLERSDSGTKTWSELELGQETGRWGNGQPQLGIFNFARGTRDPRHRTMASFVSALSDWGFYKLAPTTMSAPRPARKEAYLLEDGENLSSILATIQSEDRRTFAELERYLKAALPEVQELLIALTEGSQAYFRWKEKGLPGNFNVPSWNSSSGTRQILALLALRFGSKARPLICIEEPENFIHPGLMELVADLLKSVSLNSQVLVSTHSPYLLNQFLPEDVLIVEKKEGKTQLRPPRGKKIKEALKVLGLGELWYSGDIGGVP